MADITQVPDERDRERLRLCVLCDSALIVVQEKRAGQLPGPRCGYGAFETSETCWGSPFTQAPPVESVSGRLSVAPGALSLTTYMPS
jgi:hypothetical protein